MSKQPTTQDELIASLAKMPVNAFLDIALNRVSNHIKEADDNVEEAESRRANLRSAHAELDEIDRVVKNFQDLASSTTELFGKIIDGNENYKTIQGQLKDCAKDCADASAKSRVMRAQLRVDTIQFLLNQDKSDVFKSSIYSWNLKIAQKELEIVKAKASSKNTESLQAELSKLFQEKKEALVQKVRDLARSSSHSERQIQVRIHTIEYELENELGDSKRLEEAKEQLAISKASYREEFNKIPVNELSEEALKQLDVDQLDALRENRPQIESLPFNQLKGLLQNPCLFPDNSANNASSMPAEEPDLSLLREACIDRFQYLVEQELTKEDAAACLNDCSHFVQNVLSEDMSKNLGAVAWYSTKDEVIAALKGDGSFKRDPKEFSYSQISQIDVNDVSKIDRGKHQDLLNRAKELAERRVGDTHTDNMQSIAALYLKPNQIEKLNDQNLLVVLKTWNEADDTLDFKPDLAQEKAILKRFELSSPDTFKKEVLTVHELNALAQMTGFDDTIKKLDPEKILVLVKDSILFTSDSDSLPNLPVLRTACLTRFKALLEEDKFKSPDLRSLKSFIQSNAYFQESDEKRDSIKKIIEIKTSSIASLPKDDICLLSDEQIADATLEDYLDVDVDKKNALIERAKSYVSAKAVSDLTIKNRLTTLVLTSDQIKNLDDPQLNDAIDAWSSASRQLSEDQTKALADQLANSGLVIDRDLREKLKKIVSELDPSNPHRAKLVLLSTPASQLKPEEMNNDLSLEQWKGITKLLIEKDVNPSALRQVAHVYSSLDLDKKKALLPSDPAVSSKPTPQSEALIRALVTSRGLTQEAAESIKNRFNLITDELTLQAKKTADLSDSDLAKTDTSGVCLLTRDQLSELNDTQILKLPDIQRFTCAQMIGLAQNNFLTKSDDSVVESQREKTRKNFYKRLDTLLNIGEFSTPEATDLSQSKAGSETYYQEKFQDKIQFAQKTIETVKENLKTDQSTNSNWKATYFSREQMNELTVQDYKTTHETAQSDLLKRAEELAGYLSGPYQQKTSSLIALYLKPAAIKALNEEQLTEVLQTWCEANEAQIKLDPSKEQLQAIIDTHRALNSGKDTEILKKALGPHLTNRDHGVKDSITVPAIRRLNSTQTQQLLRVWASQAISVNDDQLEALYAQCRDSALTANDQDKEDLAAIAVKSKNRDLGNNLKVLAKSVEDLTVEDIQLTGPEGYCALSEKQIEAVLQSNRNDQKSVLDPNRMTKKQQAVFIEGVNNLQDVSSLTKEQWRFLIDSKQLTEDKAKLASKRTDLSDSLKKELESQTTVKNFNARTLTKGQLTSLSVDDLKRLQPRNLRRFTAPQLIGLAKNSNFAQLEEKLLDSAFQDRIKGLIRLGTLTQDEAKAIVDAKNDQDTDADDRVKELVYTVSLDILKIQEILKNPLAEEEKRKGFSIDYLPLEKLEKIDFSQVHASHDNDLKTRREALKQPDIMKDSLKIGDRRVLGVDKNLSADSHMARALNEVSFELTGSLRDSDNGLKNNPKYQHIYARLMNGANLIRLDRVCRAQQVKTDELEARYQNELRAFFSHSDTKMFSSDNKDVGDYFSQHDLEIFVAGDPKTRRVLPKEEQQTQLKTLLAKHFPNMTSQDFLTLANSSDFIQTIDAIDQCGLPVSDFTVPAGEGGKDKQVLNLAELSSRYEVNDQHKLVQRDSNQLKNWTDRDRHKETHSLLEAMSRDENLKKEAINQAKNLGDTLNFVVEDHVYRERAKQNQDEIRKGQNEAGQHEAQRLQRDQQLRDQISGNAFRHSNPMESAGGNDDRSVDEITNWARGLYEGIISLGQASDGASKRLLEKVKLNTVMLLAQKLDDPTLTDLNREHLKKILACYKAELQGGFSTAHKTYVDLESFYITRISPKVLNRRDLWTVDGTYYGFSGGVAKGHRSQQMINTVMASKIEAIKTRRLLVVDKLSSLSHYVANHPDLMLKGEKIPVKDKLMKILENTDLTADQLQKELQALSKNLKGDDSCVEQGKKKLFSVINAAAAATPSGLQETMIVKEQIGDTILTPENRQSLLSILRRPSPGSQSAEDDEEKKRPDSRGSIVGTP